MDKDLVAITVSVNVSASDKLDGNTERRGTYLLESVLSGEVKTATTLEAIIDEAIRDFREKNKNG